MAEKLVLPGDFLTVEEEFSPSVNTFELEGRIFSECIGIPEFDGKNKEVKVLKKAREVKALSVNAVVLGRVVMVKDNCVFVELFQALKNGKEERILQSFATLMISRVSMLFVKSLKEMFKVGDIVKASVVSVNPYGVEVSTVGKEFGVVRAFCTNCRHELHLFGKELKCTNCGSVEKRKLALNYDKEF